MDEDMKALRCEVAQIHALQIANFKLSAAILNELLKERPQDYADAMNRVAVDLSNDVKGLLGKIG